MLVRLRSNGELENKEIVLVSHRGGKGFGPENTLQSLQGALEFGVEMIETDVRMSSDGIPVIHHSPFIGLRLLAHTPFSEIREKEPEIPTLHEYLDLAEGRCAVNLEIKKCDPSVLARFVSGNGDASEVLVSSFDLDFLADFSRLNTGLELGILSQYEFMIENLLREANRCGATTLLPVVFTVRGEAVAAAKAAGLRVVTWTVNTPELVGEVVAAGVDGIITDSYAELKEFMESGTLMAADEGYSPHDDGDRRKGG